MYRRWRRHRRTISDDAEDGLADLIGFVFLGAISIGIFLGKAIFNFATKSFRKNSTNSSPNNIVTREESTTFETFSRTGSRQPTARAVALKEALERRGLRVLVEVPDGHKHIDLAIPSARINIEVDGEQHVTDPYQIASDLARSHYSDELGYDTIHIPNVLVDKEVEKIANALAGAAKIRQERFR